MRVFAVVVSAVLLTAACTIGEPSSLGPTVVTLDRSSPISGALTPEIAVSVEASAVGVSPGVPVVISASQGVLSQVELVDEDGVAIAGAMSPDGQSWRNTAPLRYGQKYNLHAKATGLAASAEKQLTFTTATPTRMTKPYLLPDAGDVVGIGQPIAVQFDEPIVDRLAAQRAITVTTEPSVEGAFYWLSNTEVRWRPQNYWTPGTKVSVKVKTFGVDLGSGMFGQEDVSSDFTIGDAVIATVDDNTKILSIAVNGQVVKTMPTSMGKDSTPTSNGVYIVGDRLSTMTMDSSTYGVPVDSPAGYRTKVNYATRMSYSGLCVHAA
ncbi:MAG: L,D-transpeptidase, partial [Mycobacteriaceae bacterium]